MSVDIFHKALDFTLRWEGYKSDDKLDSGGRTIFGIASKFYPEEVNAMWDLPIEQAKLIAEKIYYTHYWLAGSCDDMPDKTSIVHFDACVNCGLHQAAKWLQEVIGVIDDGVIGSKTITAMNNYVAGYGDDILANLLLKERELFYHFLVKRNPTQEKFLKGWLNRVHDLGKFING